MNGPTTAREALIVEALGEVALLIDRVEALTSSMEVGRLALSDASAQLSGRLNAFETRMASVTQQVQTRAIEHIVRRTGQAASDAIESQASAMRTAARLAFSGEVDSQVACLTRALQRASERADRPWEHWLTYVATAVASAVVTWLVASSFSLKC